MNGLTQLIDPLYALIRVQQRFAGDKTIGGFLIEPTFTRVGFMVSERRTASQKEKSFRGSSVGALVRSGQLG